MTDVERRRTYHARNNLFMGKAFTLCHKSYASDSKERERHQIEKALIENGGTVYDDPLQAKFII